jgi:hypothetical protein
LQSLRRTSLNNVGFGNLAETDKEVRETLVGQRTQLANTLRGHAAEFGVIAGKGLSKIDPLLTAIEQQITIPPEAKHMAILLAGRSRISVPGSRKSTHDPPVQDYSGRIGHLRSGTKSTSAMERGCAVRIG